MNKEQYKNSLINPLWLRKREYILERDNYECKECGATNVTLNVHHLIYLDGREPWEYDDDDLITLCKECHEIYHNKERKNRGSKIDLSEYKETEEKQDYIVLGNVLSAMPPKVKERFLELTKKMSWGGTHRKKKKHIIHPWK